jgi:hypothetical protein
MVPENEAGFVSYSLQEGFGSMGNLSRKHYKADIPAMLALALINAELRLGHVFARQGVHLSFIAGWAKP